MEMAGPFSDTRDIIHKLFGHQYTTLAEITCC